MEAQKDSEYQTILSKKSNAGSITISDFKLSKRAIVTKAAWYRHKNRNTDKWNRMEDPEISPSSCSHMILNRGDKNIYCKKASLISGARKTGYPNVED
jgi:hypothetical protein